MNKEKFLESGLLEQHILGLTTPEEDRIVQEHLQTFPDLKEEVNDLHQAMEQYAMMHAIPPPESEQALPTHTTSSIPSSTARKYSFNWSLLAAFLLAVLSFFLFRGNQQQKQTITQLEAKYASLKAYYQDEQNETRTQILILAKIQDPNTSSTILNGPANHFAIAYWNPILKEGWLDPTKLPVLPAGKQYHVWGEVDNEMVNIGMILPNNRSLVPIQYLDNMTKFQITQEEIFTNNSTATGQVIAESELQYGYYK